MRKDKSTLKFDEQRVLNEKISELTSLLLNFTVDSERTVFAGEPFLVPLVVGQERALVLKKIMELMNRL